MSKTRFVILFLLALAFSLTSAVKVQSEKIPQPKKGKQKADSVELKDKAKAKTAPVSVRQTTPFTGSRQGYLMVTDVLDGFGGESESDNYRIKVTSGGQPSAIGVSEGGSYIVQAGYVHASFVMRGDASGDGTIDVGDVLYLVNYLFLGTSAPCPMEAGDATCDGIVDVADALFIINYLFLGTSPPGC